MGEAKDLRNRAGSYFLKAALEDARTARLVPEIRDIDFLQTESEVDACFWKPGWSKISSRSSTRT